MEYQESQRKEKKRKQRYTLTWCNWQVPHDVKNELVYHKNRMLMSTKRFQEKSKVPGLSMD